MPSATVYKNECPFNIVLALIYLPLPKHIKGGDLLTANPKRLTTYSLQILSDSRPTQVKTPSALLDSNGCLMSVKVDSLVKSNKLFRSLKDRNLFDQDIKTWPKKLSSHFLVICPLIYMPYMLCPEVGK